MHANMAAARARSGKGGVEVLQHAHDVLALAWRPDGKLLASATLDGQIYLWDPLEAELQARPAQSAPAMSASAPPGCSPLARVRGACVRACRAALCRWRAPDAHAPPRSIKRGRLRSTSGGRPAAGARRARLTRRPRAAR